MVYELELIGLVQVVRHWRSYLWGHCFLIHTDHYSLNFLLQHQWIGNLFGFDFVVEYRLGCLYSVADALSRRDTVAVAKSADTAASVAALQALMGPSVKILDDICVATTTDTEADHIQQ